MTTTLADLLAGVDMEGGENFCDSVYNFLKNQGKDINLLTNSGVGVWSQSDTNKGLATLPFDSGSVEPVVGETMTDPNSGATGKVIWLEVTGGTWGGTNAAGNISLGAVTGTFQDNSDITGSVGGANMLTVNGDATIGVRNDPCNNDSTGLWTDDGANITLAFAVAEYTVVTALANQRAWIANADLEAGKIYKIELDIKDGTVATRHIEGYFNDGAAQYGRSEVTAAGWASVSWTFECATTTVAGLVGFRVVENMGGGGNNFEIRRFSCYEITPCCTVADAKAFDGWYKDATCDIYRQHWDATYGKCGSFYSLKIVPSHADDYVRFPGAFYDNEEWYKQFCGQPVTVGAWVYASVASHAKLVIQQTSGDTSSAYHSGTPGWEWLEITKVIATDTIFFDIQLYCTLAPDVDGTTIVYISQPMLVFGWSLGEGMYQPRLQEMIWTEAKINSNLLNGTANWSSTGWLDLNIEADSDATLPKGCKLICLYTTVNDSGSLGNNIYLLLRKSALAGEQFVIRPMGKANDALADYCGLQSCDENGDVGFAIGASAANTFDVPGFRYIGVQVN